MTTTSANPDNLNEYLIGTTGPRDAATGKIAGAVTQQATVSAASTSHGVQGTMLPLAQTLMDNMVSNEEFVRAVRDAVLDADQLDGVGTVSDAAITTRLASGNYATDPVEYVMPEVAMIGLPANSGYVDDPICAANGNFVLVHHDIDFAGLSSALIVTRVYNSMAADRVGAFGLGWTSGLDVHLEIIEGNGGGTVVAALDDGGRVEFVGAGIGQWATHDRRRMRLDQRPDGWQLRCDGAQVVQWNFDVDGGLMGWSVGGSGVLIERDGLATTRCTSIESGRAVTFQREHDRIVAMSTDDGRSVEFAYDADGRLLSARSAWASTSYVYDSNLMTTSTDADGVSEFVNGYDPAGRVTQQTSPFGRVTNYRYQTPGATVITDEAGVRQAMVHDARGNLTSIIDVDGSATRYTYDALDRMVQIVDRLGNVTVNEFDGPADRLIRRIDPDGLDERWSWDSEGRLLAHTWRNGATIKYGYIDAHRTPARVTAPDGSVTEAELDERGLPILVTDADGVAVRYSYDRDGQVTTITDALGATVTHVYDEVGRQVRLNDEIDSETSFDHDAAGRLVEVVLGDSVVTYGYSDAGRPISGLLAGGLPWTAEYGPHGKISSFRDGADGSVAFVHDTHGHIIETVAADGATYRQEFDPVGQLVAVVEPTGATGRLGYDRGGHVVEVVDPVGNTSRRTVDSLGRTTSIVAADGALTRFTHHPIGEVATVTVADGGTWSFEVDDLGRVVAAVDPSGQRSTKRYSPAGRLLERVTPAGRTEVSAYDERGLLQSLTRTDGSAVVYERDARGLVVGVTDGSELLQTATWDLHRRLAAVTSPHAGTLRYERDGGGRVTAITDATGVERNFTYDERGLLARATDGAGCATDYHHDVRGRLTAQVAPGGRTTSWEHGPDGRMSGIVDPAGVTTAIQRDANGRITGSTRGSAAWARELDPCGREIGRTSSDGAADRAFTRDATGRVIAATAPGDDVAVEFLWDDHGRLVGGADVSGSTSVSRDLDGAVTGVVRPHAGDVRFIRNEAGAVVGALGDDIDAVVDQRQQGQFDAAGRLLGGPDGSVYRYDGGGRLVERSDPFKGVSRFSYDAAGLIATEDRNGTLRRFGYDSAGRVERITIDGAGTTTIGYDDGGRRASKQHTDGSSTAYRWSALDQLIGIDQTGANGETTSVEIRLDGLGRPGSIDGTTIGYDPVTGRAAAFGDTEFTRVGALRWNSSTASWEADAGRGAEGIAIGTVRIIGHRTYDPDTHQFLSPDPLFTVPGSAGGASAYTYAWQDPVNFVDPSGLEPISIEQYDAVIKREEQGTAGAVWEAVTDDPWGTLAMVGVTALGVGLLFVPGGQAIGVGILIGVGATVVGGLATGEFDPRKAALNGVIGGATFGVGSAANAGRIGVTTVIAANGGLGMAQKFGEQTINGTGYDISDIFLAGGLSAGTAGIGSRVNATSYTQAVLYGGGTDAGAETINQLLDSDPNFSVAEVITSGLTGAGGEVFDFHQQGGSASSGGGDAQPVTIEAPISEVSVEIRVGGSSSGGSGGGDAGGGGGSGSGGSGSGGSGSGGGPSGGSTGTIDVAPAELTVTSINANNVTVAGADGTTTRIDHHVTMSDGSHRYVEVRPEGTTTTTPGGDLNLTTNQRSVIPDIESGIAEPRGAGATSIAAAAGHGPAGPTTVTVVPAGTEISVGAPIGGAR